MSSASFPAVIEFGTVTVHLPLSLGGELEGTGPRITSTQQGLHSEACADGVTALGCLMESFADVDEAACESASVHLLTTQTANDKQAPVA